MKVLDQVKSPKLTILDSMNLWINIKRDALIEVLKRVDVAMLNDGEAKMLFETHSLPTAAEKLLRGYPPLVFAGDELVAVADLWVAAGATSEPGMTVRWDGRPELY